MSIHSLQNIENYKEKYSDSIQNIYNKFAVIINEYIIYYLDNIEPKKSLQQDLDNIFVGIQCLTHTFKMILLYTKNLELTSYHCQRSIYYYIEFISQTIDESNNLLNLTSKDACLFVYTKTIYQLITDRKFDSYTINIQIIDVFINIYNIMIINLIRNSENSINIIKQLHSTFYKIIVAANKQYNKLNDEEAILERFQKVYKFIYNDSEIDYMAIEKQFKKK